MKRKNIIILSIALICICGIIIIRVGLFRKSENEILQVFNKVFAGNSLTVNQTDSIDINKITILISDKVVFQGGHFLNNIEDEYGGPNFDIFYGDKLIGKAFHYNTNDWYVNKYVFNFFIEKCQTRFTFESMGKNFLSDEYLWIHQLGDSLDYESFKSIELKLINGKNNNR